MKLIILTMLLLAAMPLMANIVKNGDFNNGMTDWDNWGNEDWVNPGETGVGTIAFGWTDGSSIGQVTGHLIKPNTKYIMTVTLKTINQAGGQAEGVTLIIQDATAGFRDIVRKKYHFPGSYNYGGPPYGAQSPWLQYSLTFDSSVLPGTVGHNLLVAIGVVDDQGWDANGNLFLDSVVVNVDEAKDPQPANGATVQTATTTELSWLNPENINKCDVYFGDAVDVDESNYKTKLTKYEVISPTPPLARQKWVIPTHPAPLGEKTYKWVVDCYRGTPVTPNLPHTQIWSFTATKSPVIVHEPASQIVNLGQIAILTTIFDSASPPSVKWYKEVSAVDIEMDNPNDPDVTITTTNVGGTYTTTLSIANATASDEGQYYCQIINADGTKLTNNGSSCRSNAAFLYLKKLLVHYSFDGNTLDSSGNNFHGKSFGKIEYEESLSKQAIQFNGTDSYIALPEGFNDFSAGLTFVLWVKPSQSTNFARFFDFGSGPEKANILLFRNNTSNDLVFQLFNTSASASSLLTPNAITNSEWQMFAISLDSQGTAILYKNGLLVNTGSVSLPENVLRINNYIGKSNRQADALYAGSIDDFRFYNYAASPKDVATLYTDINGPICVEEISWDLNKDCKIGLEDMTTLAQHWFECNLFPDCISDIPALKKLSNNL